MREKTTPYSLNYRKKGHMRLDTYEVIKVGDKDVKASLTQDSTCYYLGDISER